MPDQDVIHEQQRRLGQHRARLAHFLGQRARLGEAYEPPAVALGITEARTEIRRIKKALRRWKIPVEDRPDDEDQERPDQDADNASPPSTSPRTDPTRDEPALPSFYDEDQSLGPSPVSMLDLLFGQRRHMQARERRLLWEWIYATILGWLSLGLLLGLLQGWALRRRLGPYTADVFPFWLIVVTPAAMIAVWMTITLGFVGGALGGVAIGCIQWLDLRRIDAKIALWRWILANALGGGIAKSMFYLTTRDTELGFDLSSAMLSLSVMLSAAVFGVITGVTLVWMLHHLPAASPSIDKPQIP